MSVIASVEVRGGSSVIDEDKGWVLLRLRSSARASVPIACVSAQGGWGGGEVVCASHSRALNVALEQTKTFSAKHKLKLSDLHTDYDTQKLTLILILPHPHPHNLPATHTHTQTDNRILRLG